MNNSHVSTSQTTSLPNYLPAVAADILGLILLFTLFSPLNRLFTAQTIRGGMIFLIVYVAFAFSVNALKRLDAQPGPAFKYLKTVDFTRSSWITGVLALLVIAGFLIVQIDLNQATESMLALMSRPESYGHEGEITLYYSFGPLFLWLMVGVLYLAAMLLPTQRRISAGLNRYAVTEFVSLSLINLMMVFAAAYLAAYFGRVWGLTGQPFLAGLLALVLLEIAFDPPRLRHALKQPLWLPILTFLLLITTAAIMVGMTLS
ncbi:MAG: hypothetical protein QNJ45_05075 [Ardenticatenaceae bacterium]|nr:hypothetical protein [Ardenticatenaceae bacterium]